MSQQLDDLASIRALMDQAQRTLEDDGRYFVAWGLLTSAGLSATYLIVAQSWSLRAVWTLWAVLVAVGIAIGLHWGRRHRQRAAARTVASSMVSDTWTGVSLGLVVLTFAGGASGTIPPTAVPGVVSAVVGVGAFACSAMYRQLPLKLAALSWWAGGAAMLIWPGRYTILLMAALVLALLVAPGLVLAARARAARASQTDA
jgi:hypothetical protein